MTTKTLKLDEDKEKDFPIYCKHCFRNKNNCKCADAPTRWFQEAEDAHLTKPEPPDPTYNDLTPDERRQVQVEVLRLKRSAKIRYQMFKEYERIMLEEKEVFENMQKEMIRKQKMVTPIQIIPMPTKSGKARKLSEFEQKIQTLANNPEARKALEALFNNL